VAERVVLIFAYHFPPENAVGGARPYRFSKYLTQMGYCCHVITAAHQTRGRESDREYVPDPFVGEPRKGLAWQVERAIRRFLLPGVTGIQWSRLACRTARAFLRSSPNAEVTILSTYPPLGAHLAALQLMRSNKLRWIADFRDPLYDNPSHTGLMKFQQRVYRWLEQTFLKFADVVIANTDVMAEKWRNAYPDIRDRIHLIWNGFDPEDRIDPQPLPQREVKIISHVGELYRGRNIAALLETVSRLIDAGRLQASRIRIRLVGPMEHDCLPSSEFLTRAAAQGWLEVIAHQVPHQEARHIAQNSDALLLVQPHSSVQVPGKLFEYLRLGRPILAYVLPGTSIENILRQSGVAYGCVYAGSSPQDMENAVESFFRLKANCKSPNDWFNQTFDAEKQTRMLDALIRSIHPRQSETLEGNS
jgi:glycosyltransferase involved in cell wall biosynthesis